MKASWFHSAGFHSILVVVAALVAFAVDWFVNQLRAGTITLGPTLGIYTTLIIGVLVLLGVMLRNWLEQNQAPPQPAPQPQPVVVPPAPPAA